jgi:exonuclease-1
MSVVGAWRRRNAGHAGCGSFARRFTPEMLLHFCVMLGCDYLPSIHGVGAVTAHKLLKR